MTSATAFEVHPIAGRIGAEISGVDLTEPLAPEMVAAIRAALLRWKVVFFRDQDITQVQHIALGRCFGEVTRAHPTLPSMFPEHPEILLLDNQRMAKARDDGDGDGDGTTVSLDSLWHTDVTFVPNPPMGSILRGVVVPEYGGDTQWANLIVAYEELSSPIQRLCDELHAVHHNVQVVKRGHLPGKYQQQFESLDLRTVHPVVRVHPETGEKALFVNPTFTDYVVELTRAESRRLLALLFEHIANPTFTCRFRWRPASIAFWDNRATCHLVPFDVPEGAHRSMQRITIAGDVPRGPDGEHSYALSGDAFD